MKKSLAILVAGAAVFAGSAAPPLSYSVLIRAGTI
jgi:hypothetical protein